MNLSDMTIVITGAAGGIGKAITKECLVSGAAVIACDFNAERLNQLSSECKYSRLLTYEVDVSDPDKVSGLWKTIADQQTGINVVINNAGIYLGKNISEYSAQEVNRVLAVNLAGAIYFSQQFGKYVSKNKSKGIIINISSVSGHEGSSDAVYGSTKAALIGLTKSLAMNFSPHIRVNAIAPGLVETEMLSTIQEERISNYRNAELIKEPITPEDVAKTATFLISKDSKNYTGAVFDLNNGCYIR